MFSLMFIQAHPDSSVVHWLKGSHTRKQKDQLGAIAVIPMRDDGDAKEVMKRGNFLELFSR